MEDRCAHPEKYLISMYEMLKEIEARNETLAAATDEVKTEPTRTWVYDVCRRLPEWQQLGRRRRSRVTTSVLNSVNKGKPLTVSAFNSDSF